MKESNSPVGSVFLMTALSLLLLALCFGILASFTYLYPDFLIRSLDFSSLRPLHVSSALFWIILGATGTVYHGLQQLSGHPTSNLLSKFHWLLWMFAISGIFYAYFTKNFGGKEYWEFNPVWAFPIVIAWVLFLIHFIRHSKTIQNWPVYVWMWLTGILFFLFTFLENYLWLFPYFREHFITGMTVQWKVNGSLVGAWNQIIYGTAFFLMDRISNTGNTGKNKMVFFMFYLGLFNLMFNWGHHIYTLPTEKYVRYIGYIVSMTEWVIFIKIIYDWKKTVSEIQKHGHYFPYRFLIAAEIWIFINLGQALLMSIPALNIYTHGTHVTVAHAMGTTIGINTMILLASCFEFLKFQNKNGLNKNKVLNISFWGLQTSLLVFWISLNMAGIRKGLWQLSNPQTSYAAMMQSLNSYFTVFVYSGIAITIFLGTLVCSLLFMKKEKTRIINS
jgi:nitric oxide reductase subunit B